MGRGNRIADTEMLLSRIDVLERLCRAPAHIRDLVDETAHSRSTINRAVNELEESALIERCENGIEATVAGRLARDRLKNYLSDFDDIIAAEAVLNPLAPDAGIETDIVAGGESLLAREPVPYRPVERIHDDLIEATSYRAIVPTLDDSRSVRLLYEHVVTDGNPAELLVTTEVFQALSQEFPRRMAAMAEEGTFSVRVGEIPPFGLALLESTDGLADATTTTAHLVVYNDSGGVHGVVVNSTAPAVRWAENRFRTCVGDTTERTDELRPQSDGGVRRAIASSDAALRTRELPTSLEREGFVRVDVAYFGDRAVADPATAWRAGLSIADVHAGYAIERTGTANRNVRASNDGRTLKAELTETLASGTNCMLVGPPGSGKSTVCKQVACEWYGADRGSVLYHESGRGRAFTSVGELVRTATAAGGHTLVVVEDAVRPAVDTVFDSLARLERHDEVSVLLDAREHEWETYSRSSALTSSLEVVHAPRLRPEECNRLVDHFERTTEKSVDVSADQLLATVRDEVSTGGVRAPNEMLRVTDRLSAYVDPLAEEPTAFEEAVAAVYRDAAGNEPERTIYLLANVLNAVGLRVDRGLLYAIASDAEPGGVKDSYGTIDDALDRLSGRVLFSRPDGSYRTVHEEWSAAFLHQFLDIEGETAAASRFGTVVSELLSLADTPERCERIRRHVDDPSALRVVTAEPRTWADETIEAVYDLCRRRSTLAPLFGDGARDSIDLPEACSDSVASRRPSWLGEAFLTGGYYDRAARAFERVDDRSVASTRKRRLGLARVSFKRGAYAEAVARHEAGVSAARSHDDPVGAASHHKGIGLAKWRLGSYTEAREAFERCLDCAHRLDDRELESTANANLGAIAWSQGAYDRAANHFEAHLRTARETGDREGEATSLNNLGSVAYHTGAYDRGRAHIEESLAIRRAIGYRSGVASCLNNLGFIASKQGRSRTAEEFHERARSLADEIDHSREVGNGLWGLGVVARKQGDYDDAMTYLAEAQAVFDGTGNRSYEARTDLERAQLAIESGAFTEARERIERILDVVETLGEMDAIGRCWKLRCRMAAKEGRFEEASEHARTALELFEESGTYDHALEASEQLVGARHEAGDTDGERRGYERARKLLAEAPDATKRLHRGWVDCSEASPTTGDRRQPNRCTSHREYRRRS